MRLRGFGRQIASANPAECALLIRTGSADIQPRINHSPMLFVTHAVTGEEIPPSSNNSHHNSSRVIVFAPTITLSTSRTVSKLSLKQSYSLPSISIDTGWVKSGNWSPSNASIV